MTDFLWVKISDHVDHLAENHSRVFLVEIPVVFQSFEQLSALAKTSIKVELLLDQVEILFVLKHFVQFDDVGMVQFS